MNQEDLHRLVKALEEQNLRSEDLEHRIADLEKTLTDTLDVPWTDYSGTSTIVGWSSYTNKELGYKKIGKLVFVAYRILGAGNSTSISFTLPYNAGGGMRYGHKPSRTRDNGTWMAGQPHGRILTGSDTMNFFKYESGGSAGSWSSGTGNRVIVGQFWYEI